MDIETEKLIFKGIRSKKQQTFILLYCNPESDTYDNGTQSYSKAYNSDNLNVCSVEAHTLLAKPHVIAAIDRYRAYISEKNAFDLAWLDTNLRNLYYKVQGETKEELAVLKTIGDRIGAFKDQNEDKSGMLIPLTAAQEQVANKVIKAIMDEKKKDQISDIGKEIKQLDLHQDINQPDTLN